MMMNSMTVDEKKTCADLRNVCDGPVTCIFVSIIKTIHKYTCFNLDKTKYEYWNIFNVFNLSNIMLEKSISYNYVLRIFSFKFEPIKLFKEATTFACISFPCQ